MDVAHIPAVKRALDEKRQELFGDVAKPYAMVCASGAAAHYFDFWGKYGGCIGRSFEGVEAAYDWLGLSEEARAAASAVIESCKAEAASAPAPR
jgi:hypothetical protein